MESLKLTTVKNKIFKEDYFFDPGASRDFFVKEGHYYFMSNDQINAKLRLPVRHPYTFVGIANPHALHLLGSLLKQVPIDRIILIDNNSEQLLHFITLAENITHSKNRIEYLEKTLKVNFNSRGKKLLNNIHTPSSFSIRGATSSDGLERMEALLWKNLTFNKEDFERTYKLRVEYVDNGICVNSKTIGDIDKYIITLVTSSEKCYYYPPFSVNFGCGFLNDEKIFSLLSNKLMTVPITLVYGNLTSILEEILMMCSYNPILFWSSNIFSPYFIEKNPELKLAWDTIKRLGTQTEPCFPEMDIVVFQDSRDPIRLPRQLAPHIFWRNRSFSIHTKTFRIVKKYLDGKNGLEVVNMQSWIEQNNGVSKLPNLNYMHSRIFSSLPDSVEFDTIFFHILVGHGMPSLEFYSLLRKAKKICRRLIILEHNNESQDFKRQNLGLKTSDIRNELGIEDYFEFIEGYACSDRNLLMVYDKNS